MASELSSPLSSPLPLPPAVPPAPAAPEVAPEVLTDAATQAANTPWLVPVRAALLERLERAQTTLETAVNRGHEQWTGAIAATQDRLQHTLAPILENHWLKDSLKPWLDQWHDQIADGQTRAIASFDAIAETLTALRKLRPDAFRDRLLDLGHQWIDAHPLGAWAWGHPLWSVGILLVILSLLSGLLSFVGYGMGRMVVALPIVLGRSLAQRLHRPDLAEIDRTFERLYGDRFTPAPRDRLSKAIARLDALNREQAALLAEIQTLSGQRPPLPTTTPVPDPGDRLSPPTPRP